MGYTSGCPWDQINVSEMSDPGKKKFWYDKDKTHKCTLTTDTHITAHWCEESAAFPEVARDELECHCEGGGDGGGEVCPTEPLTVVPMRDLQIVKTGTCTRSKTILFHIKGLKCQHQLLPLWGLQYPLLELFFFVLVSKNLAFHRKVSPEHDYWDNC